MSQFALHFPQVGTFNFNVAESDFSMIVRGLLWGLQRDFEAPDKSIPSFARGEALAWKLYMFSKRWDIPMHRIKEFDTYDVSDGQKTCYILRNIGIQSRIRKKNDNSSGTRKKCLSIPAN